MPSFYHHCKSVFSYIFTSVVMSNRYNKQKSFTASRSCGNFVFSNFKCVMKVKLFAATKFQNHIQYRAATSLYQEISAALVWHFK